MRNVFIFTVLVITIFNYGFSKSEFQFSKMDDVFKSDNTAYKVVYFYTDWCRYCNKMSSVTFKDANVVAEMNKNWAIVKVNAESKEQYTANGNAKTGIELARAYKVTGYPTLVFFNTKGEVITTLPGYAGPEDFYKILTYISTESYKTVKFKDYTVKN